MLKIMLSSHPMSLGFYGLTPSALSHGLSSRKSGLGYLANHMLGIWKIDKSQSRDSVEGVPQIILITDLCFGP